MLVAAVCRLSKERKIKAEKNAHYFYATIETKMNCLPRICLCASLSRSLSVLCVLERNFDFFFFSKKTLWVPSAAFHPIFAVCDGTYMDLAAIAQLLPSKINIFQLLPFDVSIIIILRLCLIPAANHALAEKRIANVGANRTEAICVRVNVRRLCICIGAKEWNRTG